MTCIFRGVDVGDVGVCGLICRLESISSDVEVEQGKVVVRFVGLSWRVMGHCQQGLFG